MVRELQLLAKESGHTKPLLIGIDQENGEYRCFSALMCQNPHRVVLRIGLCVQFYRD